VHQTISGHPEVDLDPAVLTISQRQVPLERLAKAFAANDWGWGHQMYLENAYQGH
jgi:hypothetical protein